MKTRIAVAALLAFAGAAMAQNGGGGGRTALNLNGGWVSDQIDAPFVPSEGSNWTFDLETPAYFRITDDYIVGDQYFATNLTPISNIGVTSFAGPRPATTFGGGGEGAWMSGNYQTLETILAPGHYEISIVGDGVGGVPAGFWVQLEKVPTPGAMALLGLGGLAASRRRR
jgi:hypothetical protein